MADRVEVGSNRRKGRLDEVAAPRLAAQAASHRRRWLLVAGGLLATAAGLLVAIGLGIHREDRISEQIALDQAIQSFNAGSQVPGQLLAEKTAPAEYPFSSMVAHTGKIQWRRVEGFSGHRGVVYDLPGQGEVHAALYVVEVGQEGNELGRSPALRPFTTAGCCALAWQEGGLLYILVVQGDRAAYESYLRLPRSPVV